jgi:acetoin:2,6-dichlorophenolindophenol oxidoreductase subunit beta
MCRPSQAANPKHCRGLSDMLSPEVKTSEELGRSTQLSFAQSINAALHQALGLDAGVFVCGIGADTPAGIFGTTKGLVNRFGSKRVFDTPIAEAGLTALAAGAANAGLRPVIIHQRLDFMLYSVDQVVNWMAPWRFMSGGRAKMPVTICAIIGKGWGQGPQHTKSLHTWFAHVPGLQVVMPASPSDAKGLLLSSIMSDDPTLFIEGRSLFSMQEEVPDAPYFIRLGEALVRRAGRDVTLVSMGSMVPLALQAADTLSKVNIDAEVVDLRCLMPLDIASIIRSVKKTGRLVVAEPGWRMYGAAAEIIATVVETLGEMRSRPRRVAWPQSAVPTSSKLEEQFYPTSDDIAAACRASTTES